jgi:hypothetical protein
MSHFVLLFSYKNIINERKAKTKGEAHAELRPLNSVPLTLSLSPGGEGKVGNYILI